MDDDFIGETHRVLVVDDSEFSRRVVAKALEGSEFTLAAVCPTGDEALEAARSQSPDLVLLDLVLPGQTGLEVLKQLLELDKDAKVVMLSSVGTEDAVNECLRAGAKLFVQKPFERDDLLSALRHAAREY